MKKITSLLFFISIGVFNTQAQIITTVAGNGGYGYNGDNIAATSAELNEPYDVAVDGSGNFYIADQANHRIRKVDHSGIITTVAGNGVFGYSGDGGPATDAEIKHPDNAVVDASGNIYITDDYSYVVRKVDASGNISTIAGCGVIGYTGDGGPATVAEFDSPWGVAVDGSNNVYISDYEDDVVRMVNNSGIISTVAGNADRGWSGDGGPATAAELSQPAGLAIDIYGNLFINDVTNNRIREVNTVGIIRTMAGNGVIGYNGDGITATDAELNSQNGIAVDGSDNVYVADWANSRVRMISNTGIIYTVAGIGIPGYGGDGGPATAAEVNSPSGVAAYGTNIVYISDFGMQNIREIGPNTLGINSLNNNNDVFVYPNPASSELNLQFTNFSGKVDIKLYDILGQEVLRTVTEIKNIITVPVSSLSSGIYILRAQSQSGKIICKKVEIER